MLPGKTVEGMDAAGRAILQLHNETFASGTPAAMLFSELLPRKDDFRAKKMCPPRCKNLETAEPYKSFGPAIDKVNGALPKIVQGWRDDFPQSRIVLLSSKETDDEAENSDALTVQCGPEMFAIDDQDEFDCFMPDRLHPNAEGYELWAKCLKRGLDIIMNV